MAETLDLSLFVKHGTDGAAHMELAVEGVNCAGCIRKIETGLKKLPGVVDARVNFTNRDRKSTRLNSSHIQKSRMPSSA